MRRVLTAAFLWGLLLGLFFGGVAVYRKQTDQKLRQGQRTAMLAWLEEHPGVVDTLNGRSSVRLYDHLYTDKTHSIHCHFSGSGVIFLDFFSGCGATISDERLAYVPWDGPVTIWHDTADHDEADEAQSAHFVQEGDGWIWRCSCGSDHYCQQVGDHIWYCSTDIP